MTEQIQGFGLAQSLEATDTDLAHTVFAHPTLSEAMHEAVLDALGRAVHHQYHLEETIMTIPDTITVQDRLLTIDTNAAPIIRDVLIEGVNIQPLYLDAENGLWVLRVIFAPGITMPRHFHTGTVHLWTLSGSWNYLEYPDQPQTAGCYLFEPGGSIHTFHTPETNTEDTDTFMVVSGANVNYDENGSLVGIMDAGWIAEAVNAAANEQGLGKAGYIRPGRNACSDE